MHRLINIHCSYWFFISSKPHFFSAFYRSWSLSGSTDRDRAILCEILTSSHHDVQREVGWRAWFSRKHTHTESLLFWCYKWITVLFLKATRWYLSFKWANSQRKYLFWCLRYNVRYYRDSNLSAKMENFKI